LSQDYTLRTLLIFLFLSPLNGLAGFLEMPEITEVPDLERKSMLKDLDIPGVRDRAPDPEAGPRLNVTKFKLQGIVEYPKLGITKADIEQMIESIRSDLMEDYKVLPSGYTKKELEEISKLLGEIEDETMDRHVTDTDVQRLIWLVREQRSKRGITLGTIETVADRITQFYRERGFILAKAYIPKQEVRDGIVTLTLLLGVLGEVEVHNNEIYGDEIIASVFDDYLTLPVKSSIIEENIYLVNDFPGLAVMGFFEPGSQVGDTKLNLNVRDERRFNANIRIDNHGTDETGRQRLYGDVLFNNLAGFADQLHIGALRAFSPTNTTYWMVRYSLNLFNPRIRLAVGHSENQFLVEQNASDVLSLLDINGTTELTDAVLTYRWRRSRVKNYNLGFAWQNILSDLQLGDIPDTGDLLDDEVVNYKPFFTFDVLNERKRRLHQGQLSYINGEFVKGNDLGQDDNYNIVTGEYTLLTFFNVPFTDAGSRLIFRGAAQLTDAALSTLNQVFLGGPTRARAYPVNQFSADNAAYVGVDWIFNLPSWADFNISNAYSLNDFTQPFVFADAAHGVKNALPGDEEDSEATLTDIGFGLRLFYLDDIHGNLQFAFPVSSDFSDETLDTATDDVRVVFDLQYTY
jgi:hemolysin activation/secretion protein